MKRIPVLATLSAVFILALCVAAMTGMVEGMVFDGERMRADAGADTIAMVAASGEASVLVGAVARFPKTRRWSHGHSEWSIPLAGSRADLARPPQPLGL